MTASKELAPEQKLAAARWLALKKMPYFSAILLGLRPVRITNMQPPTMAVTNDGRLLWCDEDINSLSIPEVASSLLHEVGHVVMGHANRRAAWGADPVLFNVAGDLEWNDDLKAAGLKMFTMLLPEHYSLPEGQTAEFYYNALVAKDDQPKRNPCGSCSGHAHPSEKSLPASDGQNGDGAGQKDQPAPNSGDGNSQPNTPADSAQGMSESEMQAMLAQVAEDVQTAAKSQGNMPGGIVRWANDMLKSPVVDWRKQLAQHLRYSAERAEGEHDRTYAKPHRFQAALGYGPGRPMMSHSVGYKQRILVAVDTSGSIGQTELNMFMPEIDAVIKAQAGATIDFVSCDARIHAGGTIKTWREALGLLKGGGGTDFRPVFEFAQQMKDKPTLVLFFTDGEGPAPTVPPLDFDTIWLLTPGCRAPCNWGTAIQLTEKEG